MDDYHGSLCAIVAYGGDVCTCPEGGPVTEGKGDYTLSCRFGRFMFKSNVKFAQAKLLRDTVMGHFFNPKPNEPKTRTENDVYSYVRDHCSKILAGIPFTVVIDV